MHETEKFDPVPSPDKTMADIEIEWDQIADIRSAQLAAGRDLSFQHILSPLVLALMPSTGSS